jgi:hypothetical protein
MTKQKGFLERIFGSSESPKDERRSLTELRSDLEVAETTYNILRTRYAVEWSNRALITPEDWMGVFKARENLREAKHVKTVASLNYRRRLAGR